jgi:hypothetical protein
MKGIDMKKINSVISLSFLILLLLVSCEKGSSDNTNKGSNNDVIQSSTQQSLYGWVEFYRNPDGNVLLYKKVNIQKYKDNDRFQVWVKRVFSDIWLFRLKSPPNSAAIRHPNPEEVATQFRYNPPPPCEECCDAG